MKKSSSGSKSVGNKEMKQWRNVVKGLLKKMESRKDGEFFREPVAWKELGLLDYPIVITKPMDISTVLLNLESSDIYRDIHHAINDVRLIFKNALTYNLPEARVCQHARSLGKFFEDQLQQIDPTLSSPLHRAFLVAEASIARQPKTPVPVVMPPPLFSPTPEALAGLVDSWHRLDAGQMTAATELLLSMCPAACSISSRDNNSKQPIQLQIHLDAFDGRTFRKLQNFMISAFLESPLRGQVNESDVIEVDEGDDDADEDHKEYGENDDNHDKKRESSIGLDRNNRRRISDNLT